MKIMHKQQQKLRPDHERDFLPLRPASKLFNGILSLVIFSIFLKSLGTRY